MKLKTTTSLALAACLLMATPVSAQRSKDIVNTTQNIATQIIHSLPESGVKEGLLKYYSIISPESYGGDSDIGNDNAGVSAFMQNQFAQNTCFAEAAFGFYSELNQHIKHTQKKDGEKRIARASLGDVAGLTRPDLEAGWLFKKALEHADGDGNKAMALIGLCGHDDKVQGDYLNLEAQEKALAKGLKLEDLYEVDEDSEQHSLRLCPGQTSDFYIAQSLGRHYDISQNLKKEILEVQYPGKNLNQVASKNYHVLGAAFMTCQMIEAGMPKLLAIQVETTASSLYRGIRLCESIKTPAAIFNQLVQQNEIKNRPATAIFKNTVINETMKRASDKTCTSSRDIYCDFLLKAAARTEAAYDDTFVRGRLAFYLNQAVASALYSKWFAGGSVLGLDLPCTHAQFFGPPEFIRNAVVKGNIKVNICGTGLDLETCKQALQTIRTWSVDFDWTISQHKEGAIFAANNCQAKKKSSFQSFCKEK